MSVYRRKLRSGRRSKLYTAEFEHRGAKFIRGGFPDREAAKMWCAAEKLKLQRGAVGYVKPMLSAEVAPLIDRYVEHLKGKGRDAAYCYVAGQRLKKLAGECGWLTLGHMSRQSLEAWLATGTTWKGRAVVAKTLNQYADLACEWGKWLASPKVAKLPQNPVGGTERLQEKVNGTYRRAASVVEVNLLLATCGLERSIYYRSRIYSPMRSGTYRRLTWRMAHLDANPPFFKTPAEINKSRTEEKHAIRLTIGQEMRKLKKTTRAKADALIFPNAPDLEDLKADLAKAGIAFERAPGVGRLDFHALRRSVVKIGKDSGLSLDECAMLLGHKSPATTRKYYDEDAVNPELSRIVEKLPELGKVRKAQ